MNKPQLSVGAFENVPCPAGLSDGGHVILACSACGQGLVDVWITNPAAPFLWKMRAHCWACGDSSYETEVKGMFAPGAYGQDVENPDPQGMNDSKIQTVITRIESEGNQVVFHTTKGT